MIRNKPGNIKNHLATYKTFLLSLLFTILATPAFALQQSLNVVYTDSLSVVNGGIFPTTTTGPTGSFLDFNFYQIPYTDINTANLGPNGACGVDACDTMLLNVASSGLYCNLNRLTLSQKADIVSFVQNGGKLIIYDSECTSQDYSWLPYPFTTNNPGALGARGILTIVEENVLSTTDPTDQYYIDADLLATTTDAVGDMNVMTTLDSNWYLDMSGTNINQVTGPVHTYARYDQGLIIYNGLDVDYFYLNPDPDVTTGAENLAKIWLQELQTAFNPTPPDDLPSGTTVVGITLTPDTAINNLAIGETEHTVTAALTDLLGQPQSGIEVTFSVISGPNTGTIGTCSIYTDCTSDLNGDVSFTYSSNGNLGTDTIQACFIDDQNQTKCDDATKEWISVSATCDIDADGDIDRNDISAIFTNIGSTVPPADPILDTDGDGIVTVNDARACVLECTLPRCATQ